LANEVNSQSSSGSSTNVHPITSLNAKASSGSSINYNTNPKNVKVDEIIWRKYFKRLKE
jgi:hypothetical protein